MIAAHLPITPGPDGENNLIDAAILPLRILDLLTKQEDSHREDEADRHLQEELAAQDAENREKEKKEEATLQYEQQLATAKKQAELREQLGLQEATVEAIAAAPENHFDPLTVKAELIDMSIGTESVFIGAGNGVAAEVLLQKIDVALDLHALTQAKQRNLGECIAVTLNPNDPQACGYLSASAGYYRSDILVYPIEVSHDSIDTLSIPASAIAFDPALGPVLTQNIRTTMNGIVQTEDGHRTRFFGGAPVFLPAGTPCLIVESQKQGQANLAA